MSLFKGKTLMICKKIKQRSNKFFRQRINNKKIKQLKNKDFSLITPNCLGGFVLHDLGLQFKTPTINLFFDGLEYFDFLENLKEYLSVEPIPCPYPRLEIDGYMYPVMTLRNGVEDKGIEIHFMHYKSYRQAMECWVKRKERVNFNNIYVVVIAVGPWWSNGDKKAILERFERLPYTNKIFFVNEKLYEKDYKDVFYIKGFDNKPHIGLISDYTGWFGKRFYDQFDFVEWFNNR